MDVHSYVTPSNRTMVPVRFFSQVLGYDVFWDNGYRMVFLLDEETFAGEGGQPSHHSQRLSGRKCEAL